MLQLGGESPGLPLPVELVEKDSPCRGESGASLRTEHERWESSPRAEHRACALSTLPERNLSFSLVLGTAAREVDEAAAGHLDLHHSSCWAPTPMHPSAAKPNTHQLSKWFYLFFFFFCSALNGCCMSLVLYLVDVPYLYIFLFLLGLLMLWNVFWIINPPLNALALSPMEKFLSKVPLFCI